MKKLSRWLAVILVICLVAAPVTASADGTDGGAASLTYRNIQISVDGEAITPTDVTGAVTEPVILNDSTYLPVRAVAETLGCDVKWTDATSTVSIESADTESTDELYAGAGAAPMKFDAAMFPMEGFSGEVNDDPYARVLVLGKGAKSAIVSLELVNASSEAIRICKEVVSEKCGVPESRIWVHATHAITTMHAPGEQDKNEMYLKSVRDAITAAAEQAAESYQPAVMGVGTGTCDVNANRDIELNGKWYYGLGSKLESNKTMTILRFDDLDGKPIGFFISYGIKPTCIDNVEKETNTRKISADVPGYACVMMEKEFGVPAMFCMPAAGDQIPAKIAMYYELGENGEAKELITDRPVFSGVVGPYSLTGRLLDVSEAMVLCYEEPDMVHAVLRKATDFLIEYINAYKAVGADGVVMAEPLAGMLSPALCEEFSAPYVKEIVDAVKSEDFLFIYHNCGNNVPLMADAVTSCGADAYHFGNAIDLAAMIPHVPADALIMGNVDPAGQICNGTPESVYEATMRVLRACSAAPNFCISSGCDIPPQSPWENIDAFSRAVEDFYA